MNYWDALAITTAASVLLFYLLSWLWVGRDPKLGTIVIRYEPPTGLSPAMARYLWKQALDDRTFWAAILSLVSNGAARLTEIDGTTVIHPIGATRAGLSEEEKALFWDLFHNSMRGVKLSILDDRVAAAILHLADALKSAARGRLLLENKSFAVAGAVFSIVPVVLAARPKSIDQSLALAAYFLMMAPAAFYLTFLVLRIRDLLHALHAKNRVPVLRRSAVLAALALPCMIAILFGASLVAMSFGWLTLAIAATMIVLDALFLLLLKAPTDDVTRIRREIAGFREFLCSVEQLPFDRDEAPEEALTRYEQYLPYAVALEVDQQWTNRVVALASTHHFPWGIDPAHSFCLGVWNGRPVEIVMGPPLNRR